MPNDAARKYSAKMKTSQKCYETMMKLWMLSKKFFPFITVLCPGQLDYKFSNSFEDFKRIQVEEEIPKGPI